MPNQDSIPLGFCQCGCGQPTKRATQTSQLAGHTKGEFQKFVLGHHGNSRINRNNPNPSGLCQCGCGKETPIASTSNRALGHVIGCPVRYIVGHHSRKSPLDYAVDPDTGCWNWLRAKMSSGYGHATGAGHKRIAAHRYYYEKIIGPIPEGHELHHVCNNPACVNPDHMEPLTPSKHRQKSRGTILTIDDVLQIRSTIGEITTAEWARRLGVSESAIRGVRSGKKWRDV